MKMLRIGLVLTMSFMLIPAVYARNYVPASALTTSGTAISAYALTQNTMVTTDSVPVDSASGFNSLLLVLSSAKVNVEIQVSKDGTNFYTPYVSNMSGTLASSAIIATNLSNSRWIKFTAQLANFVRFRIMSHGTGTITAHYLHQED